MTPASAHAPDPASLIPAPTVVPTGEERAAAGPVHPVFSPGREDVLAILITLTAEKTGYPEEMLEPDLDLEADLGIDTVKQVAILAQARERLGSERDPNVALRELNTLRRAAQHLFERLPVPPGRTPVQAPRVGGALRPLPAPTVVPEPTPAPPAPPSMSATALSAASLQMANREAGRSSAGTASHGAQGAIREALLTMDFDALGMDHVAVRRLAHALAERMGVAPPATLPPLRNFQALLGLLETVRSSRG